jgi:aminotransferase
MKLSKVAKSIQPSLTRRLFDKAKKYDNVIDFTLGDPDYMTPYNIQQAGCKAILEGKTKYSANAGIIELRKTISKSIFSETGIVYNADGEIIVTVGAMEALYLTLCCLVDNGDEVIIPAPYWINYRHMTQMCGGIPIIVDSDESHDFIVEIENIKKAVTDKTVAIIINSPNNPTGTVYDRNTLQELCKLAVEHDFVIIWDECYKSIIYDDTVFTSILEFENIKDHVVVINSCSKKYSMTGWRVGYAAAPSELVSNMTKLQENIAACASLPSQYAAIEAFGSSDKCTDTMVSGFEKRRKILVDGINKINKLSCKYPKGTFYAFVNIKGTGMCSEEFANELLDKKQVAVVPGITYGDCCEGYVRMAYTVNEDKIIEGLRRIEEFIKGLEDKV